MLDDATRYELLTALEENPALSQRELARKIGISLGKTNYCLKALIGRGWVKIDNFRSSNQKSAYLYKLTPAGINEKIQVTKRFLAIKLQEHEQLSVEIERLRLEVEAARQPDSQDDPLRRSANQ